MAALEPIGASRQPLLDGGFADALAAIADVEGWLTCEQARRLWDCARRLAPRSSIVEIGSFRGRSTIVLASARPQEVELVAIDPHAGDDRIPQQSRSGSDQGAPDFAAFQANLRHAGVEDRVRHVRARSLDALGAVNDGIDLLYIDGSHRYRAARSDIERWGGRVTHGGTMLVHDAFNAIGVTLAQMRLLLLTRHWRYCGRSGSLAEYRREELTARAAMINALRQLSELDYFALNLLLKAALVAGLWPLARLLGHRDTGWPH